MKIIFVFILVMGITYGSNAQTRLGVKAGYSKVNLNYSGQAINDIGTRSDFNAGIFVSLPLFDHFYLQPEMMYSGQGSGFTDSIPAQANYNYLNFPFLFKYQHPAGLFAETGPQIGFQLSAHLKVNGQSVDIQDHTQLLDISWAFGLGYKIPVLNLGIDARYNLGLTNTINTSYALASETAKNSVFQIDLFYEFKM